MRNLIFLPMVLLAACGKPSPVADNAAEPPANITGDGPVTAGAAEAADRASLPSPTDGMVWRDDGGALRFGPVKGTPQLSLICDGARLVVLRHAAAAEGAKGTLSFTGGGEASSMPAYVTADPLAPGGRGWRGDGDGDVKRDVAKSFSKAGPVEITLGGAPNLVVPASPELAQRMRCGE